MIVQKQVITAEVYFLFKDPSNRPVYPMLARRHVLDGQVAMYTLTIGDEHQ
jgi:hypothetical protein